MLGVFVVFRELGRVFRRGWSDAAFRGLLSLTIMLLASGTLFYWRFEDVTLLEGLYVSIITLTTVGYGDIPPTTAPGRIFTIFYVIIGIGIIAAFIGQISSLSIREARDKGAGEG